MDFDKGSNNTWTVNVRTSHVSGSGQVVGESPDYTAIAARFWSKVDRKSAGECWPWIGRRDKDGYGRLMVNKRSIGAHRVSYRLAFGEIPDGLQVRHDCDNPRCVNPDHLLIGTNQDNVYDSLLRGERFWKRLPLTMRCEHLAAIYGYTLLSTRKMVQQRNPKLPTPCGSRPFVFRRDDVRRHYERRSA